MLAQALTSITFRKLTARQITELAIAADIDAIEWGGDVHVPHGDTAAAREVARMTRAAGLQTCAYGSYFKAGTQEDTRAAFEPVLACATQLETPIIRVWAGNVASAAMDESTRTRLFGALSTITEMAAQSGIRVATEYHANTFTDTLDTTLSMLDAVPALRTFWQPPVGLSDADNLKALDALSGRTESLHIYEWRHDGVRMPLSSGAARWQQFLRAAARWPGTHYATTEFVPGDAPEQFLSDAKALRSLIAELSSEAP